MRAIAEELNQIYGADPTQRPTVCSPADVASLVGPQIFTLDHEEMWIVLLDTRNRVIKLVRLYSGSLNTSLIRVGELFKQAIIESAAAIVLFHNHPSGDPSPSPEDVAVTRAAIEAGKLLDIEVLDHIVIGRTCDTWRFASLKERGLAFNQ